VRDGDPSRIATLLDDPEASVRRSATAALADYHQAAAPLIDRMLAGLKHQDADLRKTTASALGRLADPPSTNEEQARNGAWRTRVETTIAPALARVATEDREAEVRKEAADALQALGLWGGTALDIIAPRMAQEPDAGVRHALVRVCWTARYAPNVPLPLLRQLAENDPDPYVRNEAKSVLAAKR
jgi:HEAT repeat protein